MRYTAVIPAAGQGKRMGMNKNKQFLLLSGKPIIIHTVEIFANDSWCKEIILVANKNEIEEIRQLLTEYQISKTTKIIQGGLERQQSVHNGLKEISTDGVVLIHDGARPFVTTEQIHRLVEKVEDLGAAILAVPVKDTIKSSVEDQVSHTLERSNLWSVQTPQGFRLNDIKKAHQWAFEHQYLGTDDASLLEKMGKPIAIVMGDYFNIKITTQEDLIFAEAILRVREGVR